MHDSFVALDVETANRNKANICQVGLVFFEDGEPVKEASWYVKPRTAIIPRFTAIHGISRETVKDAPRFEELLPELRECLEGKIVAIHTLFDLEAMDGACEKAGEEFLDCRWLDTAAVCRRTWEHVKYRGYGLKPMAQQCGIEFEHHDALEDARAAGLVLGHAVEKSGISVREWLKKQEEPIEWFYEKAPRRQRQRASRGKAPISASPPRHSLAPPPSPEASHPPAMEVRTPKEEERVTFERIEGVLFQLAECSGCRYSWKKEVLAIEAGEKIECQCGELQIILLGDGLEAFQAAERARVSQSGDSMPDLDDSSELEVQGSDPEGESEPEASSLPETLSGSVRQGGVLFQVLHCPECNYLWKRAVLDIEEDVEIECSCGQLQTVLTVESLSFLQNQEIAKQGSAPAAMLEPPTAKNAPTKSPSSSGEELHKALMAVVLSVGGILLLALILSLLS